jgi:hypothetical protein
MKNLCGSTRLASSVLGLCGLVFATAGCDGNNGTAEVGTTDDSQGSADTGSSDATGTGAGTGESETEEDSGPPPEGLGCGDPPPCDKGTYEGNPRISTEADIAEVAGYSHIGGFLFIEESDYTCIDFLGCLETVRGVAVEGNEYLTNVDGFSNLQEVLFNITISRNPILENLSGFDAVTKVSSDGDDLQLGPRGIRIFENNALEDIDTFNEMREFEGDLTISNNAGLVGISGFTAVDTIKDHPNADPEAGTMGKPTRLGGSLTVSRNPLLERINGFSSVIVIYSNLTIQFNDSLTKLTGLYNLMALGGALVITNNPELCTGEACNVGCDLQQGPGPGSSTTNNKDCG